MTQTYLYPQKPIQTDLDPPTPGLFDVILADPAWTFEVWDAETTGKRWPGHKYSLMTLDDICSLPVSQISAPNCALFLWATWPNIQDAFKVITAWGFTYRTLAFDWLKLTKNGRMWHIGTGYYTRANPEPCLLAVRGNMTVSNKDVLNVIAEPELASDTIIDVVREHSRKPELAYQKLDRLYPLGKYPRRAELFASQHSAPLAYKYHFTHALGYDVDGRDLRDSLSDLARSVENGKETEPSGNI